MTKFTHRIEFLQNIAQHAVEKEHWQTVLYTFADVVPICEAKASEIAGLAFGQAITEELFLFHARYHPGINKSQRIFFDNELYEIKRIIKLRNNQRSLNIVAFKIGEGR